MPSWDLLLPFLAASVLFAYFPGPALLYTAAQTLARGRRAGLFAVLGIHVGCYAHVLAAAFGLSAAFRHAPEAYLALKLAGAVYLVWLGASMLRRTKPDAKPAPRRAKTARRAFIDSVLVEVLNPKTALFFIAFLPQFVDPATGWPLWLQLLTLGATVNLIFSSADIVTVFLTERVVSAARSSGACRRIAKAVAGSALIGLGAHLALSRTQ